MVSNGRVEERVGDGNEPVAGQRGVGRPTVFSKRVLATIVKHTREGAFDWVAAEAAGISSRTFYRWMELGEAGDEQFEAFARQVRQARAQARLEVEKLVRERDPLSWLRLGPGRERGGRPGWSELSKAEAEAAKEADWDFDPAELLEMEDEIAALDRNSEPRRSEPAEHCGCCRYGPEAREENNAGALEEPVESESNPAVATQELEAGNDDGDLEAEGNEAGAGDPELPGPIGSNGAGETGFSTDGVYPLADGLVDSPTSPSPKGSGRGRRAGGTLWQ